MLGKLNESINILENTCPVVHAYLHTYKYTNSFLEDFFNVLLKKNYHDGMHL